LGESQQTEAQANFLQPWMGFCYRHLFSYPDFMFYLLQETRESQRPERAQQTPEGPYQSTEKEGFSFFFFLFLFFFLFFFFFFSFFNPWGCDLGFFLFLKTF
jgi:hypothetical protein